MMQQTLVFMAEKRRAPMRFLKKYQASVFDGGGPRAIIFRREKRHKPFSFSTKTVAEQAIHVQNARERRPFQWKTDG